MMHVRAVQPADAETLAEVYRDAARGLGAQAYSPPQIEAWASFPDDFETFRLHILQGLALVSMAGSEFAAFGQLDPSDHVALLYTATRFARQGHATAVYRQLEASARAQGVRRINTTATHLSRPFFARQGFQLCATAHNAYKGVAFELFTMAKSLVPSD